MLDRINSDVNLSSHSSFRSEVMGEYLDSQSRYSFDDFVDEELVFDGMTSRGSMYSMLSADDVVEL